MASVFRERGETQRDCVARLLRERGHLTAREAIYSMSWEDGGVAGAPITRLGARIFELRRAGWDIERGVIRGMADYRLVKAA